MRAAARGNLGGELDCAGQQVLVAATFDDPIDDAVIMGI